MSTSPMTKTGRLRPSKTVPRVTQAQSESRELLAVLAQEYAAANPATQNSYQAAANTLNAMQGRTGRQMLTAANAYVMLNAGRVALLLPSLPLAATDLNQPSAPASLSVQAVNDGSAFTVGLSSSGTTHACLVYGSAGQPVGRPGRADDSYALLGLVGSLQNGVTDISALWSGVYGPVTAGLEIALQVVVAQSGIKRAPIVRMGTVASSAAAFAVPAPDLEVTHEAA